MTKTHEIDVMKLYLRDIRNFQQFSREENQELIIKAQAGDKDAWEKVLCHNARLVITLAARYAGKGVPLADLISEGNIGLAYAIKKYDPSRGTSLSTVAYFWIAQAMGRALEKYGIIRIPVAEIRILKAMTAKIEAGLSVDNAVEWASKTYKKKPKELLDLLIIGQTCSSLDAPISDTPNNNDADTFLDLVEDERNENNIDLAVQMIKLKSDIENETRRLLNDRELIVIKERFGLENNNPKTLDEVADILGVSKERVRTMQLTALKKLKRSKILRDYVAFTSPGLAY